jgi:putative Mg2+ transporter-C (MgtC) family protein
MAFQLPFGPAEYDFLLKLAVSLIAGFLIGVEREARGKPAGISTNSLVIGGATVFSVLSATLDSEIPTRMAANIITGIGFLGAGMIIKDSGKKGTFVRNLTTAASVWFSAAIGIAIGFGLYFIAGAAVVYAIIVPRLPHISLKNPYKS